MLERVAKNRNAQERLRIRENKEKPIIEDLIRKVEAKTQENYLPKSKYQKALTYFSRLIPYLKNYLSDPDAQIDNNMPERAIRPLAIEKKLAFCWK